MGRQRVVARDILHAAAAETTDGQTTSRDISAAKDIELWILVSAIDALTVADFILETAVDDINFVEVARESVNSAAVGTPPTAFAVSAKRGDSPLGKTARCRWEVAGGGPSVTFQSDLVQHE